MRATVDGIDDSAAAREFVAHLFVKIFELTRAKQPFRHAALIGDYDRQIASSIQEANALRGTWQDAHLLPVSDVFSAGCPVVDDSVAIEKGRFSHSTYSNTIKSVEG